MKWLHIIAFGLDAKSPPAASQAASSTSAPSPLENSAHVLAMRNAAKLHFSAEFSRKHPTIVRNVRLIIKRPDSKWQELAPDDASFHITNLASFQFVLQQVRVLKRNAGVHATFLQTAPRQPVAHATGGR